MAELKPCPFCGGETMDSEAQELELYIKYDKGEPVAYAYGEPWVAMALYMDDMGYPTAEEAIAAFKEKRQWLNT